MSEDITSAAADGGNGQPAPPTGASAPTGAWHESMGFDAETVGWMENRGLTKLDTSEALKSTINGFRNAEKYIGIPKDQLLRIPNWEKADTAEINAVYDKLGRPVDSKGYNFTVPEGQSAEFSEWAGGVFHEAGLSTRQAEKIAAKWSEYVAGQQSGSVEAKNQQSQIQRATLEKEWGQAFQQQEGFAKQAAQSMGVTADQIDALQQTMGYDGVMKFFANLGEKMGEPSFIAGQNSDGPLTPARAQAQIKELQGDREWAAKYLAGNVEARSQMDRLMKLAYPSN